MDGVLLDTHALIWYLSRPELLFSQELDAIETALQRDQILCISSITIVEIIYLVEKNKIPQEAYEKLMHAVHDPITNLYVLPVDQHVASELKNISRDKIPDMPDRLIVATAQYFGMSLITHDHKIRVSGMKII